MKAPSPQSQPHKYPNTEKNPHVLVWGSNSHPSSSIVMHAPRRCARLAFSRLPFPDCPGPASLWTFALEHQLPVTRALSAQPGQQWRRRDGCLRGRFDLELHQGLSFSASLPGRSREPPGHACPSRVPRGPGRNPQLPGFASTSPRRHCACASEDRCASVEPMGSRTRAFPARGPGLDLSPWQPPSPHHGDLLVIYKVLTGTLKFPRAEDLDFRAVAAAAGKAFGE